MIERKYLDMFDRLKRESTSRAARKPIEALPGWLARRRRDQRPASEILAGIPAGAATSGRAAERDLSRSA